MNTELFIKKSNIVYNSFFTYDKVIYVSNKSLVIITCPIHGDFLQSPNNHLSGYKCKKCSIENRKDKRKSKYFIQKSILKFGNKFDYTKIKYINNHTNVILSCNVHGDIIMSPSVHLKSKTGCYFCSNEVVADKQRKNIDDLLFVFNKIHNSTYDYSSVRYKNSISKIEIICKKHGSFFQSSKQHLRGQGCPCCNSSFGEKNIRDFLIKNNLKFLHQYCFDDCRCIRKLKFDFYLPILKICIEYDGIQHHQSVGIFGGKTALKNQIHKDSIKDLYCGNNNIKLYRIRYDESIEEKMNNILNEIKIR